MCFLGGRARLALEPGFHDRATEAYTVYLILLSTLENWTTHTPFSLLSLDTKRL